jgi:hypothetical protein
MADSPEQVEVNGISYSPVAFEEFASHTKYSLFGVPRYRWSNKQVAILGTFSTRRLTFTRNDFARIDRIMGYYAYLKPPSGGDAGPCISLAPAFDDAAWARAGRDWSAFSASNGAADHAPRFFFLGTILFDRGVFRSHHLALDTILFANSHSGDPAIPEPGVIKPTRDIEPERKIDVATPPSIKVSVPNEPFADDPGI